MIAPREAASLLIVKLAKQLRVTVKMSCKAKGAAKETHKGKLRPAKVWRTQKVEEGTRTTKNSARDRKTKPGGRKLIVMMGEHRTVTSLLDILVANSTTYRLLSTTGILRVIGSD